MVGIKQYQDETRIIKKLKVSVTKKDEVIRKVTLKSGQTYIVKPF